MGRHALTIHRLGHCTAEKGHTRFFLPILTVLLHCPGIPFNGWYADSEIVRNMTDEGRFNIMPEVADKLGYNLSDNASLWRDAALNVVNEVSICPASSDHQNHAGTFEIALLLSAGKSVEGQASSWAVNCTAELTAWLFFVLCLSPYTGSCSCNATHNHSFPERACCQTGCFASLFVDIA